MVEGTVEGVVVGSEVEGVVPLVVGGDVESVVVDGDVAGVVVEMVMLHAASAASASLWAFAVLGPNSAWNWL